MGFQHPPYAPMANGSFYHQQSVSGPYIEFPIWNSYTSAPNFDGNVFRNPAPEFIEDFNTYLSAHLKNHLYSEAMKCSLFMSCLTNDARVWAKVFGRRHNSYEALEAAFLRRFWGQDVQWRIRDEFLYGTYRQKGVTSRMGKYFAGIFRRVSYLSPPLSEQQFIATISAHFPLHLQQQLNRLSSVEDAYLFLIQRDRALNYSAQLYELRQQRQNEQNQASHTQTVSVPHECNDSDDNTDNTKSSHNNISKSTDSSDTQPRSLGGGDVAAKTSATTKSSHDFNPGRRFSENTLSDNNKMRPSMYDRRLDELGLEDRSSVLVVVDHG